MNNASDFIDKYLSKPNKTGDGYRLYDIHHEAETTTDMNELSEYMNSGNYHIRASAASNPNATEEQLDKAIGDEYNRVRSNAAANPNATKEQLDKAMGDDYWSVRRNAKDHPNYDRFFPNGH